ncbi:LOW QUALITY PROTEIN: hypothetical protein PHMEG_00010913, partial [Phytophthora megakarya]
MEYPITSVVQRVHEGSVNANIPCAVPAGVNCLHCSPGTPRISERYLTGRLTVYLQTLRSYVLSSHARVSILVLCLSTTLRETLRPAVLRLPSVVGFVRLHHIRNVRHQDVSGKP